MLGATTARSSTVAFRSRSHGLPVAATTLRQRQRRLLRIHRTAFFLQQPETRLQLAAAFWTCSNRFTWQLRGRDPWINYHHHQPHAARNLSTIDTSSLSNADADANEFVWLSSLSLSPPVNNNDDNTPSLSQIQVSVNDTQSYVRNWISSKDSILRTKLGKLKNQHWEQANMLLQALRSHASLFSQSNITYAAPSSDGSRNKKDPQRQPEHSYEHFIQHGFAVVDRLCQEMEYNNNNKSDALQPFLLQQTSWVAMLVAWRDFLFVQQQQGITGVCGESNQISVHHRHHQFQHIHKPSSANLERRLRLRAKWQKLEEEVVAGGGGGGGKDSTLSIAAVKRRVELCTALRIVPPSPAQHAILLHVLKRVGSDDPRTTTATADLWVDQMLQRCNHDPFDTNFHPTTAILNEVMEIWTNSYLPQAASRAEYYLQQIKSWYQQTRRADLKPDAKLYCAVMNAHGRQCCNFRLRTASTVAQDWNNPDANASSAAATPSGYRWQAHKRILELYQEMKLECSDNLDTIAYNRVCQALASCHNLASADAARAVLNEVCQIYRSQQKQQRQQVEEQPSKLLAKNKETRVLKPDQYMCSTLITAYAQVGRPDLAAAVFDFMEQFAQETQDVSLRPDHVSYASLIWAYARQGRPDKAEALLSRMLDEKLKGGGRSDLQLSEITLAGLLTSWAETKNDPKSAEYILRIIARIKQVLPFGLTVLTYNTLMTCYARRGATTEAEELFGWLERQTNPLLRPDSNTLINLLRCWCTAREPAQAQTRLEEFCQRIQDGQMDADILDARHFTVVMDAWGKSSPSSKYPQKQGQQQEQTAEKSQALFDLMVESGIQPDVVAYTSLIWAWAKSKTCRDPAERVERLFQRMCGGQHNLKPNSFTYNGLIYGMARSSRPGALDRAEQMLHQMQSDGVKPNKHIFNTLMSAFSRENQPERVEALFQELMKLKATASSEDERYEGDGGLQLHSSSFVVRLQAWSKNGNVEMATKVLCEWILEYDEGRLDGKPDVKVFTMVLQAWSRSRHPDAAIKAEAGLRQMFKLFEEGRFDCHPNVVSFNTVLLALAMSTLPDAAQRAAQLLRELKSLAANHGDDPNMRPDLFTYAQVIKLLSRGDQDGSAAGTILDIFKELETKPPSFWQKKNQTHELMLLIQSALQSSSIHNKGELLLGFNQLCSIASAKTNIAG